ncbi:MAG: T9SS type A sorting domain-containing protein [Paludibacter sp.]|nr:T9SS type A sorting domain-containing protein [Paludibacter sp.]
MKKINFLFLFFVLAFMSAQAQNVYYVSSEADGSADGLSWATTTSLDAAIAKTTSASTDIIFVKNGTYTAPSAEQSTSTGSSISGLGYLIDTKNDVTIYGNCEGTESATNLPTIDQNTTIQTYLQAPVDGTGTLGRVISIYKSNVTFIGFDISGGDASKVSSTNSFGNGTNGGSVWINGKVTLKYCKVHGGTATQAGGGVFLSINGAYTPTTLDGCEIYSNSVTADVANKGGGGIYISGTDVFVKNSTIRNNIAARAGGIYVYMTATPATSLISNCIIKDNTVTATSSTAPGGIQFNKYGTIVNSLITGNTGYTVGGVSLGSVSQIINSTIVNNTVTSNGSSDAGGIAVAAGTVRNCIIWGNTKNSGATNIDLRLASSGTLQANASTVTNSCYNVASVSTATYMPVLTNSIIATDPLFTNASVNDFTLASSSPCKNTGDNTAYDNTSFPKDLNNDIRIINSTIDMGAYEYFSTQTISSTTNTSDITDANTYGISITAQNELVVDNTKTFNYITAAPTSKLTINNGASLTTGTIDLQSDATGSATFVNSGTSTITSANVQQHLTAGRNWYISSPIIYAKGSALNLGSSVQYWDEPSASWQVLPTGNTLTPTKGYISVGTVEPSATGNVTFSGTLNDGNQSVSLTRTGSGISAGFNLVGNPYPSYLNAMSAITAANDAASPTTIVEPTIWYRTKGTSAYYFETINTTTGIGTNNSNTGTVTGYIPPMQAFWVRVAAGQTDATLNFTNNLRSHSKTAIETGTVATTPLKVSSVNKDIQKLLRLRVSNGTTNDEAIVVFNPNASNELDIYDSKKRSNNNAAIPEIYTYLDSTKLTINGLKSIESVNEIPLGFTTGQSGSFSIKASKVTNFDVGTQIILKDKLLGIEQDITNGTDYVYTSEVVSTNSRFSLIFKTASSTTALNNTEGDQVILIYKNANNQISVKCIGDIEDAFLSIYNALGQKLMTKDITSTTTVISSIFTSGVYVVNVNNAGKSVTRKLILN